MQSDSGGCGKNDIVRILILIIHYQHHRDSTAVYFWRPDTDATWVRAPYITLWSRADGVDWTIDPTQMS